PAQHGVGRCLRPRGVDASSARGARGRPPGRDEAALRFAVRAGSTRDRRPPGGLPERRRSPRARRCARALWHRRLRPRAQGLTVELADLRRRLRSAFDAARREARNRRASRDAAARDYEDFLTLTAIPAFRQFAAALIAEGHAFHVHTPAGSV